jgi:hypothetical protein
MDSPPIRADLRRERIRHGQQNKDTENMTIH